MLFISGAKPNPNSTNPPIPTIENSFSTASTRNGLQCDPEQTSRTDHKRDKKARRFSVEDQSRPVAVLTVIQAATGFPNGYSDTPNRGSIL